MKETRPDPAAPNSGSAQGVKRRSTSRPVDKYDAPPLMAKPGGSQFHVMIKPAGAACNLACTYCFYLGKTSLPGAPAPRRMSDEVLTEFIRQYVGSVTGDVVFSWQGGEPTFARVLAAARQLKTHGVAFNAMACIHRYNARRPLDVYRFLRRELGADRLQFIPIVEHRDFERTAPQLWDPATLPRDGEPRARPWHPDSVVTDWSVDPEDWLLPLQDLRRVA